MMRMMLVVTTTKMMMPMRMSTVMRMMILEKVALQDAGCVRSTLAGCGYGASGACTTEGESTKTFSPEPGQGNSKQFVFVAERVV